LYPYFNLMHLINSLISLFRTKRDAAKVEETRIPVNAIVGAIHFDARLSIKVSLYYKPAVAFNA